MENKLVFSEDTQKNLKTITKEGESKLMSSFKSKEMLNIFMIFYIIMNESYYSLKKEDIIKYFLTDILRKHTIPSLSKYFLLILF